MKFFIAIVTEIVYVSVDMERRNQHRFLSLNWADTNFNI